MLFLCWRGNGLAVELTSQNLESRGSGPHLGSHRSSLISIETAEFTRIYQDPSVDSTVTDGHRQGKKSLKLINTPSHSSNDGQASPCLNSHSTHIPILIACSILCLALPHHCPIHAPQSTDFRSLLPFLQVWVHAFL